MKAVILAGGLGTRLSEETTVKPKPMVEIGGEPILWHIMKMYHFHGVKEFIICLGYKGHVIKEYFKNYWLHASDVVFDGRSGETVVLNSSAEDWTVTMIDTGSSTLTGGRLKRVRQYLGSETVCLTYGDGVVDINISDLIYFHNQHDGLATLTAVQPGGRFGVFPLAEGENRISSFREKPTTDDAWVNGGFFVLEPEVIDSIEGDHTAWEKEPMEHLARRRQLNAYRH